MAMNQYKALDIIQKRLQAYKMNAWKSFTDPYFDSIKRQSTSYCITPGSYSAINPLGSDAGRIGIFNFRVRIYSHQKEDIDGDSALRKLLDNLLEKLLEYLLGYQGNETDGWFAGVIYLNSISEPGKSYLDKEDFLRHLDCQFSVPITLDWS